GRARVEEEAVRPGLAGRRSEPAIAHRELFGKLTDHRHLLRREIAHDALGPVALGGLFRLRQIVPDEAIHRRYLARPRRIGAAEKLFVDVAPAFARIRVGRGHDIGARPALIVDAYWRSGEIAIGFATRQAIEFGGFRVKPPEHAVERPVFQHQDDDV